MTARRILSSLDALKPHHAYFYAAMKHRSVPGTMRLLLLAGLLLAQPTWSAEYRLETVADELRWPW